MPKLKPKRVSQQKENNTLKIPSQHDILKTIDDNIELIYQDGFVLCDEPITPKFTPAISILNENRLYSLLDSFLLIINDAFLDILLKFINEKICTYNLLKHKKYGSISKNELYQFFGFYFALTSEDVPKKRNIEIAFRSVCKQISNDKSITYSRYKFIKQQVLLSCFQINTLCSLISENCQKLFISFNTVAIDETMISYKMSTGRKKVLETMVEPTGLRHMERKPHPDGFLIYQMATYIKNYEKKIPFSLGMFCVFEEQNATPVEALRELLSYVQNRKDLLIVADSAFGTRDGLNTIASFQFESLVSTQNAIFKKYSLALTYGLLVGNQRIFFNKQNEFLSVKHVEHHEDKNYICISTSLYDLDGAMILQNLKKISFTDSDKNQQFHTREMLEKMNIDEIKGLAVFQKMSKNYLNKSDLISKVLQYEEKHFIGFRHQDVLSGFSNGNRYIFNNSIHEYYHEYFGSIDQIDRILYSIPHVHPMRSMELKAFLKMIDIVSIDSFHLYTSKCSHYNYLEYRKRLGIKLIRTYPIY
ncbi:hypothetical protein WA158_005896 [Blastocystis sp. Blastoise]